MMAKMFYTLEETKVALGKSEDEIKQFAREGRLREFRDGPRLMFKADQVDQLRSEMSGGGRPDLGPSDSGAGMALAQDLGASGSGVISLADTDFGRSPGAGMAKEDTALAADLGLSGSMGGIPSPGRAGPGGTAAGGSVAGGSLAGGSMAGSMSGSRTGGPGITVFDVDDANRPDPMAQTAIGPGGTVSEQVNLEGVGSGSGLLDLTRESDDTSLGAELLDEITPGSSQSGMATARRPAVGDSGVAMDRLVGAGSAVNRTRLAQPVFVERPDPSALGFGLLALAGVIFTVFAGFAVINAIFGVKPEIVSTVASPEKGLIFLGGAAVGAVVLFVVGIVLGKGGAR